MSNTPPSVADALREYANPLNWDLDENGIRRVWREPGSTTHDAYNGFELARAALSAAEAQAARELSADELDAKRYRWLVSVCESDGFGYWLPEVCLKEGNLPPSKAESDAAIDAAMKGE